MKGEGEYLTEWYDHVSKTWCERRHRTAKKALAYMDHIHDLLKSEGDEHPSVSVTYPTLKKPNDPTT